MKAVLMVEGIKDADQIHMAFRDDEYKDDVKTLVTEGTKINNRIRAEIEDYQREGYPIYILSDPDDAGEQLAKMIQHWYPSIPRIYVDRNECGYFTGKKMKAGIEHSSYNYLKKIICPLIGVKYIEELPPICWD